LEHFKKRDDECQRRGRRKERKSARNKTSVIPMKREKIVSFRLDTKTYEKIKEIAKKEEVEVSKIIRKALRDALGR